MRKKPVVKSFEMTIMFLFLTVNILSPDSNLLIFPTICFHEGVQLTQYVLGYNNYLFFNSRAFMSQAAQPNEATVCVLTENICFTSYILGAGGPQWHRLDHDLHLAINHHSSGD